MDQPNVENLKPKLFRLSYLVRFAMVLISETLRAVYVVESNPHVSHVRLRQLKVPLQLLLTQQIEMNDP